MNNSNTQFRMTPQRIFQAYLAEIRYEMLRFIRTPACAFPTILMPILLYALVGIIVVGAKAAGDHKLPTFLFAAFSIFAITSPGMYGIAQVFASERQSGVLTLKRIQPMPAAAYLIAKIICALICVIVVMSTIIWLAITFGHVSLSVTQIIQLFAVGLLGMATFSAMGLLIGSLVSGSAAPGIVNVIYFPMIYLSGTFFPLPESLAPWAIVWPTFYLNQLFYAIALGESFLSVEMCVVVLVGLTVLFAGLAAHNMKQRN